jgi:hypothetical protein
MADLHHWLGHIRTGKDIIRAQDKFAAQILGLHITSNSVDGGTGLHKASMSCSNTAGLPEALVGTGPPEAPVNYPFRLELPVSKSDQGTGIFKSPGYKVLPLTIQPCTVEQERALITVISALIEDVNSNYMANLATEFCMARNLGSITNSDGDSCDTK